MLENKDIIALARVAAKADRSAPIAYSFGEKNYSFDQVNETLAQELTDLYNTDKKRFYSVITETLTEVVPNKVSNFYGDFAEVKQVAQGAKIKFRRTLNNKTRAKQFVTRAGLAGIYEVFKLGGAENFEITTSAMGSAAQMGIEEYLDGRVDFAEMLAIIAEGMEQLIQEEIGQALIGGLAQLPDNNKVEAAGFDEVEFDRLLRIADSYGTGRAVIYADSSFAAKLMPAKVEMFTESMKQEAWDKGFLGSYKGHKVIILPNGLIDAQNNKLANDPGYAYIIPTGSDNDKPIKVVFEGELQTREMQREDWSREIQMYRKVGVAALMTNDLCVYHDTSLTAELLPKSAIDSDEVVEG